MFRETGTTLGTLPPSSGGAVGVDLRLGGWWKLLVEQSLLLLIDPGRNQSYYWEAHREGKARPVDTG